MIANDNILNSDLRLLTKNGFEIDIINDKVSIRRGEDYKLNPIIFELNLTNGIGYITIQNEDKIFSHLIGVHADQDYKKVTLNFSVVIPSQND